MPLPPWGTVSPLTVESMPKEWPVPAGLTERRLSGKPLRWLSISWFRVGVAGSLVALTRRMLTGADPVSTSPADTLAHQVSGYSSVASRMHRYLVPATAKSEMIQVALYIVDVLY